MNAIPLEFRGPPGGFAPIEAAVALSLNTVRLEDKPRNSIKVPLPIAISDTFVAEILKPYRPNAKYLKSAEITRVSDEALYDSTSKESLITAVGRFSIPESCYIDDTGHFNAVEFNICFNQLAYVLFGKSVEVGVLQKIWPVSANYLSSFTEYKKHQLPAMLIVRIDGVRFFKPMKSGDFRAELSIDRMTMLGDAGFVYTTITFSDCDGVKAKGCVVLAFQPNLTLEG
jgi:(3R)-3-[(carboxylmethyl)amino]fatty acid synthase